MDFKTILRAIISNRSLTIEQQIAAIKFNLNAGEYREALKMNPVLDKFLRRDPFFRTVKDIRQKESYQFTGDLKKELRWIINLLEPHLETINKFLQYKNDFEVQCITADFLSAETTVDNVHEIFGVSLWSLEATLMIEEFKNGSESNWNKLSEFLKEIRNPFYEFIINNSSKRVESKLSHESYMSQFLNDVENITFQGIVKDFFIFKNLPFSDYDYSFPNLEGVLYVSNLFSVIDQYLILIDAIIYNVSITRDHDKLFLPFITAAKEKVPNDIRIMHIYNVVNEKRQTLFSDKMLLLPECMDLYYKGKFAEAAKFSQDCIKQFPNEYEFYEIYSKCLINLGEELPTPTNNSLSSRILINTYNLLKFEKKNESSYRELFKLCLVLLNTNMGRQIFSLLIEIEGIESSNYVIGFLSSAFVSPKLATVEVVKPTFQGNISKLKDYYSYKIQQFKLGVTLEPPFPTSTSVEQNTIFTAINFFSRKQYQDTISCLMSSSHLDANLYYYERKVSLLFHSYMELGQTELALSLFGDVFFDTTIVTRKLKYISLFEKLKGSQHKESINKLIEYPILASFIVKEYDLYEIYDDFMASKGLGHINEFDIELLKTDVPLQRIIYFLENVCTIDTLKYSTDYFSIGEVEEDRISILLKLTSINPQNKLAYDKEINEIYRVNSVRQVLKEVDEGRLYIDINALKDMQIKKFNADFKRYKEIEHSATSQQLIGFNAANTKDWDKALTEKVESTEMFNSADYLAFKSIYLESRDNFLFSKEYGLDSCLSTRIRHGALKNHIRSVFENLELVTSKLNDVYRTNEVWQNQLVYHPAINDLVQARLKEFSRDIDNYTIFIVDKLIQIQTEKTAGKEEALFRFFTNDEILFDYYTRNKALFVSVESTIDLMLTNLTNLTLFEIQKDIVDYFENTILKRFQEIIETTVTDLRNYGLPYDCQLIPMLIKSSTDIQQEIENISNWFYLNTTSSNTPLDIETIIDASVALTNKINPHYRISPKVTLNCESFSVFSNQVFIFNILFNNIIQHSKLDPEQVKIDITFDMVDDQYIQIKVSNNTNPQIDFTSNIQKLDKIQLDWNNHDSIGRSNEEGESGFDKIKRILIYESFIKTGKFEYFFENGTMSISLYLPFKKF